MKKKKDKKIRLKRQKEEQCRFDRSLEEGRYDKTKAGDCGNTECRLCHPEKYPRRIPTPEEVAVLKQLNEDE